MTNPFALLGEDGDDAPPTVAAPVKAAAAPVKAATAASAKPKEASKPSGEAKKSDVTKGKGGRDAAPEPESPVAGRGEGRGERGAGRGKGGKGGGRGRKDGEEGRPPRQREFDRHVPGNGRRDTEKRGGAGKANWGTATEVPSEEKKDDEVTGDANGEDSVEEKEPEVPDNEMTLEEYQKNVLEKRNALLASYNVNKRTVAVDTALQSNILKKKDEEDKTFVVSKAKEAKSKESTKSVKEKEVIETSFRVRVDEPPRREFGGKGDRGGKGEGRGKGGKGGGKGGGFESRGRSGGPGFNALDEFSFPSLK